MKSTINYILHVDDDEEDYCMLNEAVKEVSNQIEVGFMKSLPESMKALTAPPPDLIFLDINMPAYDGFYWLEEIGKEPTITTPVIMYSTASTDNYVAKAYDAGAHLFLVKPSTYAQLVASLHHILHLDWQDPVRIRQQYHDKDQSQSFQLEQVIR
jgi:CheY-like chemotaxis protein